MLIAQLGKFVIPLITFPYLTRVLGLETYGIYVLGLAIATYLSMVTQYGFNLSSVSEVSKNRHSNVFLGEIILSVLISQLILFLITTILMILILENIQIEKQYKLVFYCFIFTVLGNIILVQWFHQGLERMASVAGYIIFGRIASIPLIFMLVKEPNDAWLAALLHSVGILLAGLISVIFAAKRVSFSIKSITWVKIRSCYVESTPFFFTNAASTLYTQSVPLIVGAVSGAASVGIYNVAQVFRNIAVNLLEAILQTIFPRSIKYHQEDLTKLNAFIRKYLLICSMICLFGIFITISLSDYLVLFAAGPEYYEASSVLIILICSVLIGLLNNFLGVQTLVPRGYKSEFSKVVVIAGAVSLPITGFLTSFYGEDGAAFSVLIAESVIFIGLVYLHKRHNIDTLKFWEKA